MVVREAFVPCPEHAILYSCQMWQSGCSTCNGCMRCTRLASEGSPNKRENLFDQFSRSVHMLRQHRLGNLKCAWPSQMF